MTENLAQRLGCADQQQSGGAKRLPEPRHKAAAHPCQSAGARARLTAREDEIRPHDCPPGPGSEERAHRPGVAPRAKHDSAPVIPPTTLKNNLRRQGMTAEDDAAGTKERDGVATCVPHRRPPELACVRSPEHVRTRMRRALRCRWSICGRGRKATSHYDDGRRTGRRQKHEREYGPPASRAPPSDITGCRNGCRRRPRASRAPRSSHCLPSGLPVEPLAPVRKGR